MDTQMVVIIALIIVIIAMMWKMDMIPGLKSEGFDARNLARPIVPGARTFSA